MPQTPAASTAVLSATKTTMNTKVMLLKKLKKKGGVSKDEKLDDFEEWKKARAFLKPPDQLPLPDVELKEEMARVLSTTNTQQPNNLVEYSYAEGSFIPQPPMGNTIVIVDMKGTTLHIDSHEAQRQIDEQGIEEQIGLDMDFGGLSNITKETTARDEDEDEGGEPAVEEEQAQEELVEEEAREEEVEEEMIEEEVMEEEEGAKAEAKKKKGGRQKKLTNQFNFSERAALTYNLPTRSQETQTQPPPRGSFSGQVYQWVIFDAYAEDYAALQREKEKEKKVPMQTKKIMTKKKKTKKDDILDKKIFVAWKTLERMVNLNTYDDIAKDYRFWEDPSDEYREEEGTLLPLWKFQYEKTFKKNMVTDILFNPWYYDLFAVCFGSFNFMNQGPGAVCLFTMKNPSYPEHICLTECGVMSVDIHPKYPFMIVTGLYNGTVCVYNVQVNCKDPQYQSNSVVNKHNGMVWEVKWGQDLQDGEMNFYSASADGRIRMWILMLKKLCLTNIITLDLQRAPVPGPDGVFLKLKGNASCMVFHPKDPLIFLVGTEEGIIYKCSTLYTSTYLFTYKAHHMPVYRIDYNKYNHDIFASCSGDWRIKIWEDKREEPLFVFDLAACVGDIKWAPYSSTVFAALTSHGHVSIYDININKYKAVCRQAIVSRRTTKLTRLAFNKDLPILIIGDDRGVTHSLKISPNLRIMCKPPKKQLYLDQDTLQRMKLDKLLALVREPQALKPPEDVEISADD